MRISQGTGIDLSAARLDAVRTAGADRELVFTVPEEEPEPGARRAREERDRERETAREDSSIERRVEASVWAAPVVAPSRTEPTETPPAALDREPRKAPVAGNAPGERESVEGRASAPVSAKGAGPEASDGQVEGRPDARPSAHGVDGAKARGGDPLPEVDGVATAPEGASPTVGPGTPAEAVASASAQAPLETSTAPAAAPSVSAAARAASAAVAPKGSASEPSLPEGRAKGAPPEASSLPTVTGALPAGTQRQSDNGLTPVNGSAPATLSEGESPLRARLQDALRSSLHQRVLQQPASGEVVLPGLGRVAVTARAADSAVAVEVHAAQSATAKLLHASAGDIAADVLSAEIPLSTLTFAGAGTWTRSDGHAPSPERDPSTHGTATDENAATPSGPAIPSAPGRVRIVL